ncbi:SUMF1/EgtB/PvdO family nonheme iron enzyme [Sphaerotilus microaerophilus]|uniref:TIR domain-containing protein n=1 Tax=Sphaerotilus microaerophilus TaxID=2914710 RepID=A0ABN6PJQ5_9BURK|nr:SUMF1/EgtB/PvdO family nonheme iron enzyme [Sphaerotilus sp. FB-5]BDI04264.1 hypothetical protein CATMQ487_12340 [Sphaerotilus sp. FB-5]
MPAGIFISYRRQDSLKEARAIFERLSREFGAHQVFIDQEGLDYGVDFVDSLERQLQHCQVMLALIGPGWIDAKDGSGRRRLDDVNDFVRIELRTALQRNIRVVPVLLDGAPMPRTVDLPADLEPLARRQKIDLDFQRFDADIGRLVGSLRRMLPGAPAGEATPKPAGAAVGAGPGWTAKTAGMAAGVGALALGAVWYANQPSRPALAAAPAEVAASVAPNPVSAPVQAPPSSKAEPAAAASPAVPPALTAAQAEALRQAKPDGQEIYNSLQLKPKEPPPQPQPLAVGQRFRDCDDDSCPWMVVLPAGSFMMGSPESEPGRDDDEGPQHRVKVASFAVGQYEVTFRQWDACVGAGGCKHKPGDEGWGRGQRPVINVSWSDAQQYVKWLSGKTGQTYRLPSEAEWEYAARAGTITPYAFGESLTNCHGPGGSPWMMEDTEGVRA